MVDTVQFRKSVELVYVEKKSHADGDIKHIDEVELLEVLLIGVPEQEQHRFYMLGEQHDIRVDNRKR